MQKGIITFLISRKISKLSDQPVLMEKRIVVIGAEIGGLTTGAVLSKTVFEITVLEVQTFSGRFTQR